MYVVLATDTATSHEQTEIFHLHSTVYGREDLHWYRVVIRGPNRGIQIPRENSNFSRQPCTQNQISKIISCIVDNEIAKLVALIKADMSELAAKRYHLKYLNDSNFGKTIAK
ncbi:hypothetical protein K501DRAFT_279248 [Backusella circina FSU 941]|nr:hypothetical protein K501DRAFT_279248 [Backusella circina FSU 941]